MFYGDRCFITREAPRARGPCRRRVAGGAIRPPRGRVGQEAPPGGCCGLILPAANTKTPGVVPRRLVHPVARSSVPEAPSAYGHFLPEQGPHAAVSGGVSQHHHSPAPADQVNRSIVRMNSTTSRGATPSAFASNRAVAGRAMDRPASIKKTVLGARPARMASSRTLKSRSARTTRRGRASVTQLHRWYAHDLRRLDDALEVLATSLGCCAYGAGIHRVDRW